MVTKINTKGSVMNELQQAFDILLNNKSKDGCGGTEERAALLNAEKPLNPTINLGVGEYSVFTEKDGERLLAEAESLGLIKKRDFPAFPYIKKQEPKHAGWRVVHDNLVNVDLSSIKGTSYVTHNREGAECYYVADTSSLVFKSVRGFKEDTVISVNNDLKEHLSRGHNAYVDVSGSTVLWATVSNYLAIREWRSALSSYHNEIHQWVEIKKMVVNAKEFHRAWKQDLLLSKLPFKWRVGVKPKLPVKPSKDNRVAKSEIALTHLMFEEDHHIDGVLSNRCHSFLCAPKIIELPQKDKPAYEHELRIEDVLIKKIAYEITCPECLERIKNLLNRR